MSEGKQLSSSPPKLQAPVEPSKTVRRLNLTVVGCLVVFFYLYCVDVFLVIVPWLSYSVPGVTNLSILTFTAGASLYCYLFCVFVDPGKVPDGWLPDQELASVQEVKRKGGAPRFCQKCQQYKPPRSHHCRVCQRCVLRMDHHCPWTNNCIGHANYRAFMIFLVYVNAALVHTLGLIASHAIHTLHTSQQRLIIRTGPEGKPVQLHESGLAGIWVWAAMQAVAFTVGLPLTLGLVMLLVWHVQLVLSNKTTIEYQEGVTASLAAAAAGSHQLREHPYDLGGCNNLHEIMGEAASDWVLPPCSATEGGTKYPTIWEERMLGIS